MSQTQTQQQSSSSTLEDQNRFLQQQLTTLQQAQLLASQTQPGGRIAPIRQSRILDRPVNPNEKDSTMKIKIELDLEVEVDLYARVKGDVLIGLM
ncbi:MAG: hypothetical protein MMC33_004032 [Icmadophila ericetorum]|nr:hypothetical protein [Icmadophila ericetorum]